MSGKRIPWTEEEDRELRSIYALSNAGQAARAMQGLAAAKGCRPYNVRYRARSLGIARTTGGHRRWTKAEIENLTYYAGKVPTERIARILARSFDSIASQLSLMKLSGRVEQRGYEKQELADLLGIDRQHTLKRLLIRFPMPKNPLGNFAESEVCGWLWNHLEDLELRKMNQSWLKTMLKKAA